MRSIHQALPAFHSPSQFHCEEPDRLEMIKQDDAGFEKARVCVLPVNSRAQDKGVLHVLICMPRGTEKLGMHAPISRLDGEVLSDGLLSVV